MLSRREDRVRNTRIVRLSVLTLSLGLTLTQAARADEVVQFTNGAEMTVQAHAVTKDMVKLDLGGNSSISFPLAMVNKIVSAGQDVFRNPIYYPANQAIAGTAAGGGATSYGATQSPFASGRVQKPAPGQAGMRLGEAADGYQQNDNYGSGVSTVRQNPHDDMSIAARPHLDPMRPLPPGGVATIDPPNGHVPTGRAQMMSPRTSPPPPPPPPPSPSGGGETGSAPEPPANDDGGGEPPPTPDPSPNR